MTPTEKQLDCGPRNLGKITIKQKIMLHLMRFTNLNCGAVSVPYDTTQDGIASVVGISRPHASIEMKKLRDGNMVYSWKAHILGSSTKRFAYVLSEEGYIEAENIVRALREHNIDPDLLLDMKRCDPAEMWATLSEEDRDTVGKACVLRVPVPRSAIPRTSLGTIPVDRDGMISFPPYAAKNFLSFAEPERKRAWHSWAADYWRKEENTTECLYHLVMADRTRDAGIYVARHWEILASQSSPALLKTLKKMDPDYLHAGDVYGLMAEMALDLELYDDAMRATNKMEITGAEGWMEIKAEVLRRTGRKTQAADLAVRAFKHRPSVRAAAVASLSYSDRGCTELCDEYARLAFETLENTGEAGDIDMVLAARAASAASKGNMELATTMIDQALKSAPAHRKRMMGNIRDRILSDD